MFEEQQRARWGLGRGVVEMRPERKWVQISKAWEARQGPGFDSEQVAAVAGLKQRKAPL